MSDMTTIDLTPEDSPLHRYWEAIKDRQPGEILKHPLTGERIQIMRITASGLTIRALDDEPDQ